MKNKALIIITFSLISALGSDFLFASACDNQINVSCLEAEMIAGFEFQEDYCMVGCNQKGESGAFDVNMGCQGSPFQTAWYILPAQSMACYLDISLQSSAIDIPSVSVYRGGCDNMELIRCNQGSNGLLRMRTVSFSEDLIIAVSSAEGTVGEFNLCIMIVQDENLCNVQSKVEVVSTDKGSALTGPFLPGEKVEVCYTVSGYNVEMGCNYLHAIVPIFGNGWDPSSFDTEGQPVNVTQEIMTQGVLDLGGTNVSCDGGSPGSWEWYPDSTVKYKLNTDNPLQLNSSSMIPPAWVFLNSFDPSCFNFDEACCTNPTSDPNEGYGDHNWPLCFPDNDQEWQVCFELIANTQVDCANSADCTIAFKTLSDGELGTYTDKDCQKDRIDYLDATVVCCESPIVEIEKETYNICQGDDLEISLLASDNEANFFWYSDDGEQIFIDTEKTKTIILEAVEEESIELEIYASNGCISKPFFITIIVDSPAEAAITQDPPLACSDEEIRMTLESQDDMSDYEIEWNNDPTLSDTDILVEAGVNSYSVLVRTGACSITIEHEVAFGESPIIDPIDDMYITCDDFFFELDAGTDLSSAEHEFIWMQNNAFIGEDKNILVEEEGVYTLEVIQMDSGCSSYDTIQVFPNPSNINIEFLQGSEIQAASGSPVMIDLVHNMEDNEVASIRWFHDGTIDCDDCESITAIPSESVEYIVEVTDIYGCSELLSISIRLLETDTPGIYIPNVLMPDIDGANGYLRIYDNGQIEKVHTFSVYNRWGEKVHMVINFNIGDDRANWNGMAKDEYLDPGVYMYMVDYQLRDGTRDQLIGHVTLLK